MSVYLGNIGCVQLQRTVDETGFIAKITPGDIDTVRNRFSYDYVANLGGGLGAEVVEDDGTTNNSLEMQYVPLISGDRVRFQRVEKNEKGEWVNSEKDQELADVPTKDSDFVKWVNVDGMYGIRLFQSFEDAVNANNEKSFPLLNSSEDQYFKVIAGQSDAYKGLAKVTNYEFTTNREQIDVTNLGKNFRRFYTNGLINGQGRLECLWPSREICSEDSKDSNCETAQYLSELILRLEEGAVFSAKFVLVAQPITGDDRARSVFYQCDKCMITSVGVTVEPDGLLRSSIQFITSGPFSLRYQYLPAYLLLNGVVRDDSYMLQENEDRIEFMDDDYD